MNINLELHKKAKMLFWVEQIPKQNLFDVLVTITCYLMITIPVFTLKKEKNCIR